MRSAASPIPLVSIGRSYDRRKIRQVEKTASRNEFVFGMDILCEGVHNLALTGDPPKGG